MIEYCYLGVGTNHNTCYTLFEIPLKLIHMKTGLRLQSQQVLSTWYEGTNLDRHLFLHHVKQGESNLASSLYIYPLTRSKAPTAGVRPAGEGANIYRSLVPYT